MNTEKKSEVLVITLEHHRKLDEMAKFKRTTKQAFFDEMINRQWFAHTIAKKKAYELCQALGFNSFAELIEQDEKEDKNL